jgi:hypothetical protein
MAATAYRLPDEPLPSGLAKWAVDPLWPLLGVMFGGNGLGMAWFVFNGLALGSPTRGREWTVVAANLVGCLAVAIAASVLRGNGLLAKDEVAYVLLLAVTIKLVAAYALYMMQARCFELWEYFGGRARNGLAVVIVMGLAARPLIDSLPHVWLMVVLQ